VKKIKLLSAQELVSEMYKHMVDEKSPSRLNLQPGSTHHNSLQPDTAC